MTVLTPRKSFESKESVITVEELPVGAHVIRLIVVDDDGNSSDPFDVTIEVIDKGSVLPIDTTPPKVITTVPDPGDPVTRIPIKTINAPNLADVVQPLKTTRTVKTTKPPATSKPTKPTNAKPGDQK